MSIEDTIPAKDLVSLNVLSDTFCEKGELLYIAQIFEM